MRYFSTHPDSSKKLGCALIFNNIYREFREEEDLISIFWLEILHIFIGGLASFENIEHNESKTVEQMKIAIKHLQRVFVEKATIFRQSDSKRRVPHELNEGLLKDVAIWLLQQTSSRSKYCRESSMELFLNITPLVAGKPQKLETFIKHNFPGSLLNVYETELFQYPSNDAIINVDYLILFKWMKTFLCTLDGYNFVIRNNLEDVDFKQSLFINQLSFFLTNVQDIDFIAALNLIQEKQWHFAPEHKDLFNNIKSYCLLAILKMYNSALINDILVAKADNLWRNSFWKLIVNILFQPHLVNINAISKPKFEAMLKILIRGLLRKLPGTYLRDFTKCLEDYLRGQEIVIKDLNQNVSNIDRDFVNGLLFLSDFEFDEDFMTILSHFSEEIINKFANSFYSCATNNKILLGEFRQTTFKHFENVLKLGLKTNNECNNFLNHLYGPYFVQNMEYNEEVCFGMYVLKTFSNVVVPSLINNFNTFLEFAMNCGDMEKTIEFVIFILQYFVKEKTFKQKSKDLSFSLMRHWHIFENYFNSGTTPTERGIEYVKLLLQIITPDQREVHNWLISCLLKGNENSFEIFELLVLNTNEELANAR